ncbi:glycine oxidase ThiO [Paenibacillus beijingensis]|uniref:glycine oxidase n=1 Tax=Paenibacillus beijingensis TaxID=1126833 RepID=A0A0D5NFD4_9BACL|nr:glycine oxidase ThiO [Paenibacillus beijingensis]AJY73608.1 glycine oxidase [Paenibacillus beijingensis]
MKEHVIVLGGGIIGLSCALEAVRDGRAVTVIESQAFGGQASGAAAGMLAPFSENTEQPDPFFRLCLDSLRLYPKWLEKVEGLSGMKAEWLRTGSINAVFHEADLLPLQTRLTWQSPFTERAELVEGRQLRELEPLLSREAIAGVYIPEESHINAPLLVAALEKACRNAGVTLIEHAGELTEFIVKDFHSVSSEITVGTSRAGSFQADRIVLCTGAWSGIFENWFNIPVTVHPIRGQICAYEVPAGFVRHMVFTSQAYWVGKNNGTLVCGASEDVAGFDSTVTEHGIQRLCRWTSRMMPFLAGENPVHSWAGLRPATRDGWPLLGRVNGHPNIIMAAGHYRNGILLSPITAYHVGRLLDGAVNEQLVAFAPERFASAFRRQA